MKATLVFPGINLPGFDSQGKLNSWDSNWINHGLAYLSSSAKAQGHKVDLIDLRALRDWKHFEEKIKQIDSQVIGISSMTNDYDTAKICLDKIKEIRKDIVTVLGGVHASIDLNDVVQNQNIDYIITGEGEISFTNLLNDIEKGNPSPRVIDGIPPDLSGIPWADRELFDIKQELNLPFMTFSKPFVSIIITRGCPYKCTFCQPAARTVFGGKVRRRSVENVIEELKYLKERYNFNSLMIHDDLFTISKKWVMDFCDQYEKNNFPKEFVCQMRADKIVKDEDMMKRLKEVGLKSLIIGFESGSQRILDFLKKDTTVEDNFKAAEICHKLDIKMFANIMFGTPTETKEEAMMTAEMVRIIKPFHFSPSFFVPYKGSHLYDYVIENDLLVNGIDYTDYDRGATHSRGLVKGIDYKFLRDLVDNILTDLFTDIYAQSPAKKAIKKIADMVYKNVFLRNLINNNKLFRKLAERLRGFIVKGA